MSDDKKQALEKRQATLPEGVEQTRDRTLFVPPASIYETDDAVVVSADMPGVAAENVDITVEDNVLTLRGTSDDQAPEGMSLVYGEYETGDYHREFSLSSKIDVDGIEAKMDGGVLTLTLPKVQPSHRKIEVQASGA